MDIGIFINYDGQVVQIPVNPSEIKVNGTSNNKNVEIIQLGEISILKQRKLKTIEWECWFPYLDWHHAIRTTGDFRQPDFYVDYFEKIISDCKPARLIVTGININMEVSIEDFSFRHQAGDHEDKYYSISLKEWRPYKINQIATSEEDTSRWGAKSGTTTAGAKESPRPQEITIGCDVILNGRVHYDSYGAKPGKTFSNYKGKINYINKNGTHIYHVTTPSGGWLGWVEAGDVVLA